MLTGQQWKVDRNYAKLYPVKEATKKAGGQKINIEFM
jgi:hypothetical protein